MNRPPSFAPAVPPQGQASGSSMVLRIGFLVAGGVMTALASSLPAALRMGDDASPVVAVEQWMVLSALATPLAILAVVAIGRARAGLRILAGDRAVGFLAGVLWWCVVELAALAFFGAVLRKATHNHALAGVAFAAWAAVSGFLALLFARRVSLALANSGPGNPKVGFGMAAGCMALLVLLVMVRTGRVDELHTAGGVVDALLFGTLATVSSSRFLTRFRPLAVAGMPVAVIVVIAGLTTLALDPKLRDSLAVTAPIHGVVIDFFR